MFSSEEHPGLFTILIGVVALVFVGIGLSVLMDKRAANGGRGAIVTEIHQADQEIVHLKELRTVQERHYSELSKKVMTAHAAYPAAKAELATREARLETLRQAREDGRREVATLEGDFATYQADRRQEAREGAVGMTLNALRTKSGKTYVQVVLRRVTSAGLEITHSSGAASIPATDLEKPFHDKFQWTAAELEGVKKFGMTAPPPAPVAKPPAPSGPAPEDIAKVRNAVLGKRSQVTSLVAQLTEAEAGRATGKTSVPGSLETWNARVNRLQGALTRAKGELSVLRARLAELSPRDPLTVEPHE